MRDCVSSFLFFWISFWDLNQTLFRKKFIIIENANFLFIKRVFCFEKYGLCYLQKNNSLKTSVYNWSENTDSNRFKNDENLRIFYVNASADEIILIFQLSWFLLNGTSVRTIKWTFFSQFNTSLIGEVTMFIIILHEYVIVHNNFVHVTVSQFVYIVRSANF